MITNEITGDENSIIFQEAILTYPTKANKEDEGIIIRENLECSKYWDEDNEDENNNSLEDIKKEMSEYNFDDTQKEIENQDINYIKKNTNYETIGNINDIEIFINSLKNEVNKDGHIDIKNININDINNIIHKYRQIGGDGNCFFRAVIFYFLENIILSNNIELMKRFVILFNKKMDLKDGMIKQNKIINADIKIQVVIMLLIILRYMEQRGSDFSREAYLFFLKAFLFSEIFDYTLIFFTRFLIYDFMKLNENKVCKRVEVGNLLPNEYKEIKNNKNKFLFKHYYKDHLLKMQVYAENSDVIMIPFVFKCNLNIIQLQLSLENNKIKKKNIFEYRCETTNNKEINLLYTGNHYNIFYKKDYYEKYSRELNNLLYKVDYNDPKLIINIKEQVSKAMESYNEFLSLNKLDNNTNRVNAYFSDIKYKDSDILLLNVIKEKNLSLEDIIKNMKECLVCGKSEKIFKTLPCGCTICSNKCFGQYLEPKINEESIELENGKYYDHIIYCCKCGKKNNKNDIKDIIVGKEDIEDEEVKDENYHKIVENHWQWKCNLCIKNESFDRRFRYYRLIFKGEKNPFTKKELEHLICFTCKNEKIKGKEILCQFCKKNHIIDSIKNVSEENENETSCNII